MSETNSIACFFWDSKAGTGKNPGSTCEQKAAKFVRKAADRRLCPLCNNCLGVFEKANASMSEETRRSMAGEGKYEVADISGELATEYAVQPPRTK